MVQLLVVPFLLILHRLARRQEHKVRAGLLAVGI
jgi:hypothetical protein